MEKSPIAAVLGLGINGLGIIRSLAQEKIKVFGFYDDGKELGRFSRYCVPVECPPIREEEKLLQFLIDFGNHMNTKIVLFADNDAYILFISKYEEILSDYFLFNLPERIILEKLINKKEFYRTCEELGILHPKTYYFNSLEEVSKISCDIEYPCIVKPIHTRLFTDKFGEKVIFVQSKKELLETCESINDMFDKIIVQEVIHGGDDAIYFCGAYIGSDYEPQGVSLGRKIRQSSKFGVTTLAESINDNFLIDHSVAILKKLKYKGLCDLEFKRDPKNNSYKVIEINARTGLWHMLCTASGVNLCALAFYDLTKVKHNQVSYNKRKLRWINEVSDLAISYQNFKQGELSLRGWIDSLKGVRCFATFNMSDPMPFIFLFYKEIKHFIKKSFENKSG